MHAFLVKCHFFRNDDPYRYKTQHMSRTWSVLTRLRAKFRHRKTLRLGGDRPTQNKQTLKYLVDGFYVWNERMKE